MITRAGDAVRAAMHAQRSLSLDQWPPKTQLRVRMGLHSGEAPHLPNWLLREDWQQLVRDRADEIDGWEMISVAGSAMSLDDAAALGLDELRRVAAEFSEPV